MAILNVEGDFLRAVTEGQLIPVIMYHDIFHKNSPRQYLTAAGRRYAIDSDTFWQQMEYLYENGFQTVPLDVCVAASRGYMNGVLPEKAIAISFDDGNESNCTIALPILKHFGFSATFFIATGCISTANHINRDQIDELVDNDMILGSHTVTHRYLTELDDHEMYAELFDSKHTLEAISEQTVTHVSLPGGRCNDYVLDAIVRAGYEIVCTSNLNNNETASEVLAQSICEMIPLRLSRMAITTEMNMDHFSRIVTLDEWEILRRQRKQAVLNTVKYVVGDGVYDTLWEKYWTVRSILSRT